MRRPPLTWSVGVGSFNLQEGNTPSPSVLRQSKIGLSKNATTTTDLVRWRRQLLSARRVTHLLHLCLVKANVAFPEEDVRTVVKSRTENMAFLSMVNM